MGFVCFFSLLIVGWIFFIGGFGDFLSLVKVFVKKGCNRKEVVFFNLFVIFNILFRYLVLFDGVVVYILVFG